MVRTKKGRQTNNSKGRKRAPPASLLSGTAKTRKNEAKLDEIDVTTIADDDPTYIHDERSRRSRQIVTILDNDSSDDDDMEDAQDSTPRKGEDKKRQRFAAEAEVIEIQQDDNFSSSRPEIPRPTRLTDRLQSDSSESIQTATIADILGEGPEEVTTLPQPLVISKDCRFTFQVKVLPCELPNKYIAEKVTAFYKWIQNKIGKELSIATWDDATEKQRIYAKAQQLPKSNETTAWTAIWGTWVNIKPQQEGTAFLKIRFVTKSPDTLTKRLNEIGALRDEIIAETGIHISRLPIACQAVQVGCVGWLFGSNKHMNSNDLLQEIVRLANIPTHIRMGISWRAIKLENGRSPPWVDNEQPASALHLDMDWFHAPVYKPILANLFKKHGTTKPLGLSLRLIPCFSADEGKNSTNDQRMSAIDMREKQEYLIKRHITVIKTPYILNLDKPTKPNGSMTLRRYLKNLHPQGLVAARLILSVDKVWKEGSMETNIVTTREYAPQVQDALRNMIPECVFRFGTGTKGWFTREGLMAFRGVEWDPTKKKTVSDRDIEALRTVTEDYFGMGEAWRRKKKVEQRPTNTPLPKTASGTPEESIPNFKGKPQATVEALLSDMTNKGTDAPSFGDLYNRPHDGDTAKTSQHGTNDDASLSSHESDTNAREVSFADIPPTLRQHVASVNGDASTAKSSTYYRLQRDKSRELAAKSQEESRQLLESLRLEREELMKAREELERLRVTPSGAKSVTPSANRERAGASADGAGDDG